MAAQKHIRFDWAIKRLLRQKANFDVLEGFLSELLKFDVKIQEILESEGNKQDENDKFNRVDLLAKNEKGDLILIEVQNEKEHDYFHRMNYAQAKLITEHINSGELYAQVKRVYSINIVYFELGQGKDYVYIGKTDFKGLHDNDVLQLSENQKKLYSAQNISDLYANYYIIKTNNFDDVAKDTLDEWIYFLKNSEIKDEFRAKGLQSAKEKLRVDNLKGYEKEKYDNFIKEQRIKTNEIESAVYDGLKKLEQELRPQIEKALAKEKEALAKEKEERRQKEEALAKEKEALAKEKEALAKEQEARRQKEEARIKLAQKMLKYGEPIEDIMQETSLSREEIEKLN